MKAVRDAADAIGRGLLAGLIGTAAMTASSTLEARLSGRGSSTTPADAISEVSGMELTDESTPRVNTAAHWGYGTAWGAVRGLLGLTSLPAPAATALHLGLVWGGEQALLPTLGVAAPTWSYGVKATGTDLLHHAVYAAATGLALAWIEA